MIEVLKRILPLLIAGLVGFSYGRWGAGPVTVASSKGSDEAVDT